MYTYSQLDFIQHAPYVRSASPAKINPARRAKKYYTLRRFTFSVNDTTFTVRTLDSLTLVKSESELRKQECVPAFTPSHETDSLVPNS